MAMPTGYIVAHIRVHDKELFTEFQGRALPTMIAHGGRILSKGPNRLIELDRLAATTPFYEPDEYQAAEGIRDLVVETDLLLIEAV